MPVVDVLVVSIIVPVVDRLVVSKIVPAVDMWVVPEIVPAVDRLVVSIIVPAVDDLIVPAIEKFIRHPCPTFHSTSFRETTHGRLRGGLAACFAIASRAYSAPSAVMSSVMFFLIFHKMEIHPSPVPYVPLHFVS